MLIAAKTTQLLFLELQPARTALFAQGTLTFVRVYSGALETGTFVSNPNKGKKERIGRIQLMHANNREDIKVSAIRLLLRISPCLYCNAEVLARQHNRMCKRSFWHDRPLHVTGQKACFVLLWYAANKH